MDVFLQQVVSGLASGAVYAAMALALVLIFRSTGMLNLAQGEMAMFATYVAWQLNAWGVGLLVTIVLTLVVAFIGGAVVERVIIRPVEDKDELTVTIVTLGLFLGFNSLAGWIWTFLVKDFPSLFPGGVVATGAVRISYRAIGTVAVTLVVFGILFWVFKYTSIGLRMRAVANNPESSRLVGIPVGRTLALSWGIASVLGTLAGVLVAPALFLEPNMLFGVLLYAFAAATLGGLDSFGGAILGGLIIGVVENLAGTYIPAIGADLKIMVALGVIVVVLLFKPEGMFGSAKVARV